LFLVASKIPLRRRGMRKEKIKEINEIDTNSTLATLEEH
jgi:hypothetical protein